MKSLAEYFQAFDSYAVENDLSASSRTLYYTLLGMFNERFWKVESVSISVRDMQVRGGFQSSSAVERAKAILGTENIVKIDKLKNRKTQYKLVDPEFWLRNSNKTVSPQFQNISGTLKGQSQNTCDTSPFINYTLHDTSKEDKKDLKTEREKDNAGASEETTAKSAFGNLSQEIKNAWRDEVGEPTPRDAYRLREFEKRYGASKVVKAINAARDSLGNNRKITTNYLQSVLRDRKEGEKVGATNGSSSRNTGIEKFDYDWAKADEGIDWSKYD